MRKVKNMFQKILNKSDIETLVELLSRSHESIARESLCLRIGIDSRQLSFIRDTSDADFFIRIVNYLDEIGDQEALCKLCCNELFPIFSKGIYRNILEDIAAKLNCNQEIRPPDNLPKQPPVKLPTSGFKFKNKVLVVGGAALGAALIVMVVNRLPTQNPAFSKIEQALEKNDWKEADQETKNLVLDLAKPSDKNNLQNEDIENISCPDIKHINHLWEKFSQNKFGFRIQQSIWEESRKHYNTFSKKVGWSNNYDHLKFASTTIDKIDKPDGHLPAAYTIDLPGEKFPQDKWFSLVKDCFN